MSLSDYGAQFRVILGDWPSLGGGNHFLGTRPKSGGRTRPRGRVGSPPSSIGRLCQGIEAVYRGLVLTFLRLFRPSLVCGGFVFFWLFAVAVVSHQQFLVSRLVLGLLLCGGFVFVFS